jgi:GNAT superfamily N-acetyltransferase
MHDIQILILKSSDKEAFDAAYTAMIQAEFPEYSQTTRDYFTEEYKKAILKGKYKLAAFEDGKIVGFLVAADKPMGGILFVNWLAVSKDHQHKGIGRKLLEHIDIIARELGCHAIYLEMHERNMGFYTKCGYEVIGHDPKGYFGTDNYFMKKTLREPEEKLFLKEFLSKKKQK